MPIEPGRVNRSKINASGKEEWRFLQDRDEADSAPQDVFLKAYQALIKEDAKEWDDPGRWLTRIAVNTCLDRLRSRKWQFWRKRPSSEDEAAILAMTPSAKPEAEEQCFAGEIGLRLRAALEKSVSLSRNK